MQDDSAANGNPKLLPMRAPGPQEEFTFMPSREELQMDNKDILTRIYAFFSNGLRAGKAGHSREYIRERGFDLHKIPASYNSEHKHTNL